MTSSPSHSTALPLMTVGASMLGMVALATQLPAQVAGLGISVMSPPSARYSERPGVPLLWLATATPSAPRPSEVVPIMLATVGTALPAASTWVPLGLVMRTMLPALAAPELTYRLPSVSSTEPVGLLPATITASPTDPASLSVSVAGSNLNRRTEVPLVELSGTYTKLVAGSKLGWPPPGSTQVAAFGAMLPAGSFRAASAGARRHRPLTWSVAHRWVPIHTLPPGVLSPPA